MIDPSLIQAYRQFRAEDLAPPFFANWLKYRQISRPSLEFDPGSVATWRSDGFDWKAEVCYEQEPDLSYLGEFTDKWQPGCIKRRHIGWNEYQYFLPAQSYTERFQFLRRAYTRHEADCLARQACRQDHQRAESYGQDWHQYSIHLTASRKDRVLAEESVGWVDLGKDFTANWRESLNYQVWELYDICLPQARQKLRRLGTLQTRVKLSRRLLIPRYRLVERA